MCIGQKVNIYLSDISDVFDKVFLPYLLTKLHRYGIGGALFNFLRSYLAPRTGQVVVQGTLSDPYEISNTVFQGTVLGPPLWNAFFSDEAPSARSTGGREAMFADDLNVFQQFKKKTPVQECKDAMARCKETVHKWGTRNRVTFDAGKEHVIIIHPSESHGDTFKLLGCPMDVDLRMHSAVEQVLSKIRPKITAILRTRQYYTVDKLILQFKTQVWGLVEVNMGGFFHAASSLLDKIDAAQNHFLHELDLSPSSAFLNFNFVPPSLRRNIGILGLLHKRVLGKCHPTFERLFPWETNLSGGHTKQLYGHWCEIEAHQAIFNRSIFRMCDIYNNLPQVIVDAKSVNSFQYQLTQIVRRRCQDGQAEWALSFSRRSGPDI